MADNQTPKGALVAALIKAKKAFKPVTKGKTAEAGKYSYRYADLATAIEATEPALLDNGLLVLHTFEASGAPLLLLKTTLWHESGESISGTIEMGIGEMGVQDVGGIITYLRRYSYLAILGISPEDDDGASAQKASETRRQSTTTKPPATKPASGKGPDPEWLKMIGDCADAMDLNRVNKMILEADVGDAVLWSAITGRAGEVGCAWNERVSRFETKAEDDDIPF